MTAVFGFEDVLPLQHAAEPLRFANVHLPRTELFERVADLVQAGDVLRRHYLELLNDYERTTRELHTVIDERDEAVAEAGRMQTYLDQDALEPHYVVTAIRAEHDEHHPQPWAICEHTLCRVAGRWW